MKIVVIGTGYVGLTQGVALAHLGHEVVCVDIDQKKVNALNRGEAPIFEKSLPELLQKGLNTDSLRFTTDLQATITSETAVIFVCVQTPQSEDGSCDLRFIEKVLCDVGSIASDDTIVVVKSTVPPGTRCKMHSWLKNLKIEIASNPEFLRQGTALHDFLNPDRIVVGVESDRATDILKKVYQGIDAPMFVVSVETAQLIKYASNAMLAARLSFMNEIAKISEQVGADVKDVEQLVGLDHRIGRRYLRSSAGFGGECLPKDTQALCHLGEYVGSEPDLLRSILSVNENQPKWFVKKIESLLGNLSGQKIAVWGLSFNRGTDDVRYSPAIMIVKELLKRGAKVHAYDPQAMKKAKRFLGDRIEYAPDALSALDRAEALFVLTEWPQFTDMDWGEVKQCLSQPIVFDSKHFLPHRELWNRGFRVHGIGLWRPKD